MNNKQQGIALISIMIIEALITTAIMLMVDKQQQITASTRTSLQQSQAINYFYSIQSWAKKELSKDNNKNSDSYDDDWATEIQQIIPGGFLSGRVTDLSAKLNINNVIDITKNGIVANSNFSQCLNILNLNLNQPPMLDYILVYLNNKEERTLFSTVTELQKTDIPKKDYLAIKPYIFALNNKTKININTANSLILQCLHHDISEYAVEKIMQKRPFKNLSEAKQELQKQLPHIEPEKVDAHFTKIIDTKTNYFKLDATIKIHDTTLKATSIMIRKNGKITTYYRTLNYEL